jgi:hypothetical protein
MARILSLMAVVSTITTMDLVPFGGTAIALAEAADRVSPVDSL